MMLSLCTAAGPPQIYDGLMVSRAVPADAAHWSTAAAASAWQQDAPAESIVLSYTELLKCYDHHVEKLKKDIESRSSSSD